MKHQLLVLLLLCARGVTSVPLRLLFVGNSYSFGLDQAFNSLYSEAETTLAAQGGAHLSKHASTLGAELLQSQDILVLQEQSQVPSFPLQQISGNFLPAVAQISSTFFEVATSKAKRVLLLQTWAHTNGDTRNYPDDTYADMQERVVSGYSEALKAAMKKLPLQFQKNKSIAVVRVGETWSNFVQESGSMDASGLWQSDGSHPSAKGTMLAATVLYCSVFNKFPVERALTTVFSASEVQVLRQIIAQIHPESDQTRSEL